MDARPDRCSYCNKPEADAGGFITGPAVAICAECLGNALNAIASTAPSADEEADYKAKRSLPYCAFCGKSQVDVKRLAYHESAQICNECLILSLEILLERGWAPARPTKF